MTANECITGRRSIRKFTGQPVPHETLEKVVEAASFAPSWKNTQITRYIAVEGAKKETLADCTSLYPGNGNIMRQSPMVIATRETVPSPLPRAPAGRCLMQALPPRHFVSPLMSRDWVP